MKHWIERYCVAHKADFQKQYPSAFKDGHYSPPILPKTKTANGLTLFIMNFLKWNGWRATRINTVGRSVDRIKVEESGSRFREKKWIKGSTRKGTADISATIRGRSVMMEIKAGEDRPSVDQILEQALERKAGGIYEFIKTPDDFFELYDSLTEQQ